MNSVDRFARVIFKITQQAIEFLFQFFNLGLLIFLSLRVHAGLLAVKLFLASAHAKTLGFRIAQLAV